MNKKLRRWFGGAKMMFFRLLIQPLCWFFRRRADRVVFSTFDGNGFMDNSKYVAQELIRRNFPGELIWLTSPGKKADFPPEVRRVSNKFFSELYYLATAGVWVDTHFKRHIFKKGLVKRSDQLYIQTWHGSLGIKAMKPITESSPSIYYPTLADVGSVNYMISNSTFENEYYRDWFFTPEVQPEIFMAGHPRNDIFFRDNSELVERLKRNFNLQTDDRIFTYMPTFRKGHFCDSFGLDFGRIRAALADTFGGNWYIFMRLHPGARQELQNKFDEPGVIDVSEYPDAQEILAATDVLCTDYSSCIYDFILSRRPGFIYAVDLKSYETSRGLRYPLTETPFAIAENNDELVKNIRAFDRDAYLVRLEEFLRGKGCIDDGHAAERVADIITDFIERHQ